MVRRGEKRDAGLTTYALLDLSLSCNLSFTVGLDILLWPVTRSLRTIVRSYSSARLCKSRRPDRCADHTVERIPVESRQHRTAVCKPDPFAIATNG